MNRIPIPLKLKRQVLIEAGHRCAIPSCKTTTTEIAHIDPYSKVREHKFENLIALCPNCHTRFDKGEIDRLSILEYKANLKNYYYPLISGENDLFEVTLWADFEKENIVFKVENNSNYPLLDFVLFIDKTRQILTDLTLPSHFMEVVFGTIPPNNILTHKEKKELFLGDTFGFPILSGQFSDKKGKHWKIDEKLNIKEIEFRFPFD